MWSARTVGEVIVDQQIVDCQEPRLDRTLPRWRSAGTWQAALLVAEERMAGLGSATATARERGEKSNLRFSKLGAPLYGSFGVFCPRGW